MKKILIPCMIAATTILISSCASTPSPSSPSATVEEETIATSLSATEQTLLNSLNADRSLSGKPALILSSRLGTLARNRSVPAAAAAQFPADDTDSILARSGFHSVGKLQGTLKDRGPKTGAGFIDYWKKEPDQTLSGPWTHVGLSISKSSDGRLFAVVILGGSSSGQVSLMEPAMHPSGL